MFSYFRHLPPLNSPKTKTQELLHMSQQYVRTTAVLGHSSGVCTKGCCCCCCCSCHHKLLYCWHRTTIKFDTIPTVNNKNYDRNRSITKTTIVIDTVSIFDASNLPFKICIKTRGRQGTEGEDDTIFISYVEIPILRYVQNYDTIPNTINIEIHY